MRPPLVKILIALCVLIGLAWLIRGSVQTESFVLDATGAPHLTSPTRPTPLGVTAATPAVWPINTPEKSWYSQAPLASETIELKAERVRIHRRLILRQEDQAPIIHERVVSTVQPDALSEETFYRADRILLSTRTPDEILNKVSRHTAISGIEVMRSSPILRVRLDISDDPFLLPDLKSTLETEHQGLIIGRDYLIATAAIETNDPLSVHQWHLGGSGNDYHIQAFDGWEQRRHARSVVVAILDSGVDISHPDLVPNLWENSGEIAGDGIDNDGNGYVDDVHGIYTNHPEIEVSDPNGHGTHVAGIIGARGDNRLGVTGIAWQTQLMAVRFMGEDGSGYLSDAVEGFDYARLNGARVINCSFGSPSNSSFMRRAIERARDAGVVVVAAAGNDGSDTDVVPGYPALYTTSSVISVASTQQNGALSNFSNFNSTDIDVAAPGSRIASTYPVDQGSYVYLSGTSMATPVVAGMIALLMEEEPNLETVALIDRIKATSRVPSRGRLPVASGGIVSLSGALSGTPPANPPTISDEIEELIIPVGNTLSLSPTVNSDTDVEYSWIGPDGSYLGATLGLEISSANISDSGIYSLTATNEAGSTQRSWNVTVMTPSMEIAASSGALELPWISSSGLEWINQTNPYVMHSPAMTHNESSSVSVYVDGPGTLHLEYYVSSEAYFDFFEVKVDGITVLRKSGNVFWDSLALDLNSGQSVITFSYDKDHSVSHGEDRVSIRNVWLEEESAPEIILQPRNLTLAAGESGVASLSVDHAIGATFVWFHNEIEIANTQRPKLAIIGSLDASGSYHVELVHGTNRTVSDTFSVRLVEDDSGESDDNLSPLPNETPITLMVGELRVEVEDSRNGFSISEAGDWLLKGDTPVSFSFNASETGAFSLSLSELADLTWAVTVDNAKQDLIAGEPGTYWFAAQAGERVTITATNTSNEPVSFVWDLNQFVPDTQGPVAIFTAQSNVIDSLQDLESIYSIVSASTYSIDWTLTPLEQGTIVASSDSSILSQLEAAEYRFSMSIDHPAGVFDLPEVDLAYVGDRSGLFPDSVVLTGNWYQHARLGLYYFESLPWIMTPHSGWWHIAEMSSDRRTFWARDTSLGWIRIDLATFPYVWSDERNSWLYLYIDGAERSVYAFDKATWIE